MTYRPKHPTLQIAKASVIAGAEAGGSQQRARLLAYAYLRSKPYRKVERSCYQGPQPQYERQDLDGPSFAGIHLRRLVAAYVTAWLAGDEEFVPKNRFGSPPNSAPELLDRIKLFGAAELTDPVVRCPDLPAPAVDGPKPVSSSAPSRENACDTGQVPGGEQLLTQV